MPTDCPPSLTPTQWGTLRVHANHLATRYYGCPVYLVGSALTDCDPRDVDVVIVVPDDLFVQMYGDRGDTVDTYLLGIGLLDPPAIWRRWSKDVVKRSLELTERLHRSGDCKIMPERTALGPSLKDKPRLRLDTIGLPITSPDDAGE